MFYTNCMSYNEKDVCVCPVMARANHSCRPNAEFISRVELGKYSPQSPRQMLAYCITGKMELRAMYMIEAGEEVT